MPMPDEYDPPFTPEPLFARGCKVSTLDSGLCLTRVPYGPDCGLTEHQARSWAALLAQAPQMHALIVTLASGLDCGADSHLTHQAIAILAACAPKAKGRPFRIRTAEQEIIV